MAGSTYVSLLRLLDYPIRFTTDFTRSSHVSEQGNVNLPTDGKF